MVKDWSKEISEAERALSVSRAYIEEGGTPPAWLSHSKVRPEQKPRRKGRRGKHRKR